MWEPCSVPDRITRWGEAAEPAASQPIGDADMTKNTATMTFTPEALKAVLDAAIADAVTLALGKAAKAPANTLVDGKTENQLKIDIAVVRAFKRAGINDAKPRENVMTYNKWMAEGFKVKPGEKAVKVKQFRLFHKSQVEFVGIPPKEKAPAEATVAEFKATKRKRKPNGADQPSLPV
jgi:hypothetical protein